MKDYDRFLAAVKISGCFISWLLFCSMITQCERNRALAEGNDVEFSIVQTGSTGAAAEYYSDDAGNVVFGVSNFSFDAPLLLSSPVSGTSVCLLFLSVDLSDNEPLAAKKVYRSGDGLTDLNITVSYQVEGSDDTFTARLEGAALKISLLSDRYATGIFSGAFVADLTGDGSGTVAYNIDDGYFNIPVGK